MSVLYNFHQGETSSVNFSGRRRRTRTVKVRTALSRPCPAGQTDNGQLFFETENVRQDRHRTRFSGKSGQKRDKDRTVFVSSGQSSGRTRTRQGCPDSHCPCPTSAADQFDRSLTYVRSRPLLFKVSFNGRICVIKIEHLILKRSN